MVAKIKRNRKPVVLGFTLMETMVATAVLGIIVLAASTFMGQLQQNRERIKHMAARSTIANRIQRAAGSAQNIRASLIRNDNQALVDCVLDNGNDCVATGWANKQKLVLHAPYFRAGAANATSEVTESQFTVRIAGTDMADVRPVRWKLAEHNSTAAGVMAGIGGRCEINRDAPDAWRCPFLARTWFWASCQSGQATCRRAKTIHTVYQLQIVTDSSNPPAGNPALEIPPGVDVYQKRFGVKLEWEPKVLFPEFSSAIPVDKILRKPSQLCGDPNARQKGVDNLGNIECQCNRGFDEVVSATTRGKVNCNPPNDQTCPAGTEPRGIRSDGTLICLADAADCTHEPNCAEGCECSGTNAATSQNADPAWIHSFKLGGCQSSPNKKGGGSVVTCDNDDSWAECCVFL